MAGHVPRVGSQPSEPSLTIQISLGLLIDICTSAWRDAPFHDARAFIFVLGALRSRLPNKGKEESLPLATVTAKAAAGCFRLRQSY